MVGHYGANSVRNNLRKGFPAPVCREWGKGELVHDPLIKDDPAIIADVKGKCLVIISRCGHAGIIDTINTPRNSPV